MHAIVTKFIPATNTRGARIKATSQAGSVMIAYDYSGDASHRRAAQALCEKMGWPTDNWIDGGTPDNSGFAFVRAA